MIMNLVVLLVLLFSISLASGNILQDPSVTPGFILDQSCTTVQQALLADSLKHAQNYIKAALLALAASDQALPTFFFHKKDVRLVSRAFGRLLRIAFRMEKTSIIFLCKDIDNTCNDGSQQIARSLRWPGLEHAGLTPKNNAIKLCPAFFDVVPSLETNPCDKRELEMVIPGTRTLSRGLILLHEMLHLPYLIGPAHDVILDVAGSTYNAHALLFPDLYDIRVTGVPFTKIQPLWSVNNYVIFAKWAWISQQQPVRCPGFGKLWGALNDGTIDGKMELRSLLSVSDGDSPTQEITVSDVNSYGEPIQASFLLGESMTSFNVSSVAFSLASISNVKNWGVLLDQPAQQVNISWVTSPTTEPFSLPT